MEIPQRSAEFDLYTRRQLQKVESAAIRIFRTAERQPGSVPSETSPPMYVYSFRITRDGRVWYLSNIDPGAVFVEFGAHAGGKTRVLGYSPMRKGMDAVAAAYGGGVPDG
jgi:hypothetical protein